MSDGESVSYEVYKMVRGRWTMHARFGDGDRDAAFKEASAQEKASGVSACCIIKESYSAADNAAMESVVYHSASLTEPPSVRAVTREQVVPASAPEPVIPASEDTPAEPASVPSAAPEPAAPPVRERTAVVASVAPSTAAQDEAEPELETVAPVAVPRPAEPAFEEKDHTVEFSIFEAALRFFAVLFLSLLGGTLFGAAVFFILKSAPALGLPLTTDLARTIILSSGLLGAVAAFFPLLRYLLPDMNLVGRGAKGAAQVGDMMLPGLRHQGPALAGAMAGGGAGMLRREPPPPPPPVGAGGFDSDEAIADKAAALGLGARKEQAGGEKGEAEAEAAPEGQPKDKADAPPAVQAPAPVRRNAPEDVAAVTEELQSLANEAKSVIDQSKARLDPYRCFGLTLFLAGAGESLGRWHRVTQRRVAKSVAAIIEGLGASAEDAAGFAYHIDEYLLEPRFHEMYAAGRSSAVHRQYDDEGPSGIADAMNDWSRPAPQADAAAATGAEKGLTTVMLTRVAARRTGSVPVVAPLQAEYVRVHDEIVRDTQARYGGREIKHTGDGVLVSFPSAAAAVEAASSIQQLFRRLRETTPEVSAAVSIVVATGAPIQTASDPRRTPVRIAAALMSRAGADDILAAPPVPDLMKGQSFRFDRSGTFQIAGIADPVPLFRVNW